MPSPFAVAPRWPSRQCACLPKPQHRRPAVAANPQRSRPHPPHCRIMRSGAFVGMGRTAAREIIRLAEMIEVAMVNSPEQF